MADKEKSLDSVIHGALKDLMQSKPQEYIIARASALRKKLDEEMLILSVDDLCNALADAEMLIQLKQLLPAHLVKALKEACAKKSRESTSEEKDSEVVARKVEELQSMNEYPALKLLEDRGTRIVRTSMTELFAAINLELDINPKNVRISKSMGEAGGTPSLNISFISKMQWNAFHCKQSDSNALGLTNAQMADEVSSSLDHSPLEVFNSFHYPPIPEICVVNGKQVKTEAPQFKKVGLHNSLLHDSSKKHTQPAEVAKIYKESMRRFIMLYPNVADGQLPEQLNLCRYQVTQRVEMNVEVRSFHTGDVFQYPHDTHLIRSNIGIAPFKVRKWAQNKEEIHEPVYQLDMPSVFKLGKPGKMTNVTSTKEKAYYIISANMWDKGAHICASEHLSEFDIKEFSLRLGTPKLPLDLVQLPQLLHRMEKFADESFFIEFVLIRHVVAPTLSVLLPLWLMQLMLPFAWLIDIEETNDALSYLVAVLLTATSHRVVMEEKMQFVQRITHPDKEFILTIVLLFANVVGIAFFNRASQFIVIEISSSKYFMFEHGINVGFIIFAVQTISLLLRLGVKLLRVYTATKQLSSFNDLDIRSVMQAAMSLARYSDTVSCKNTFERLLENSIRDVAKKVNPKLEETLNKIEIDRKTFFSFNVKRLCMDKEVKDLFRIRLGKEWREVLGKCSSLDLMYSKPLIDKSGGEIYAEKVVYQVKDKAYLEVQFVEPTNIHTTKQKHDQYKKQSLQNKRTLQMEYSKLLVLLLKSVYFEMLRGNFSNIKCDMTLFWLIYTIKKEARRKSNEDASEAAGLSVAQASCSIDE